jgi:hypothetical protein
MYNSKSEVDLANIRVALMAETNDNKYIKKQEYRFQQIPPATQQLKTKRPHYQRSLSNASLSRTGDDDTNINSRSFMDTDDHYIAEQLTYIDKELFQKVLPYHCLGAVWSTRKKLQNENFETINSFIEQFNIVTFIVQGNAQSHTPI